MDNLSVTCDVAIMSTSAQVWDYVAERYFDHHARWDPAVTGMRRLTDGPVGKGTRGVETRRFLTDQRAEFEITEYEPGTRFAFRNTSGPFALERAYVFIPAGAGTRLTFRFEMAPKGPMKLLFPLLRSTIARQVHANIARIPALVEAHTS